MKNLTSNLNIFRRVFYSVLLVLLSSNLFGQGKINEQEAMKKSHIDFKKEYVSFNINGFIEIDGHTFINDTCKCPIQFHANLDGITIIDICSNVIYKHRICANKSCNIIHLQVEEAFISTFNYNLSRDLFCLPEINGSKVKVQLTH